MSVAAEALVNHLERPAGFRHTPDGAYTGAAGGAACGDLIRLSIALDQDAGDGRIGDAGFDASGCGATVAAGSAAVSLVRGVSLLDAARVGAETIAGELGGLSAAKRHAAELAADALHRALGAAAREGAQLEPSAGRTLVAMSGGVDSAVAALLVGQDPPFGRTLPAAGPSLRQDPPFGRTGRRAGGAQAVGVTLELWSDPQNDGDLSCCSAQAVRGARALAHGLGMPHLSIDLRAEFRAGVVDGWLSDHARGLTPNPCVRCNGSVRLDAMLELARRLGAATLATGHYARVAWGPHADATPLLRTAADERKDQSYVLCALAPESLARLRFPLGELRKPDVRELAERAGLAVARRRDSQDLCFLAGTRHAEFLERHAGLARRPGPIVDEDGGALGVHDGAHTYTVGQRRGLGISASQPLYVLATDARANTVTVGPRRALLAQDIRVEGATLHRDGGCVDGVRVRAHGRRHVCRLRACPAEGRVLPQGGRDAPAAGRHARLEVELQQPVERTAPGQIACLYAGDVVVGYGTIS